MNNIPKLRISPLPSQDKSIQDAFRLNQLVTGPHLSIFENRLANSFNFKYANTTSSGFGALFLALKSLSFDKARIVIPAVSTCHAITNAVLANGFEVVFCDIDPTHLSLCDVNLSKLFREKPFDAIIAPSHFGIPAPIDAFKKYGVPVIEDACQAFFTRTTIKSTADIMVLSFYPTKQFNCIEGGAVLHNNVEKSILIEDLRYYNHQTYFDGTTRYNLRMANLHAAFGCLLLEKLEEERNRLIEKRNFFISGINQKDLLIAAQCEAGVVPWRFLIKSDDCNFFNCMIKANIQSDIELSYLDDKHEKKYSFRNFRSIPYYSELPEYEQIVIINSINSFFSQL